MADPNRKEILEQLHNDLSQFNPADEQSRQILNDTRAQIRRAMNDDDSESLVGRLGDTVSHFEGTHPDLANTIAVVIDTLSNMGL
jgi:hypothetical protein